MGIARLARRRRPGRVVDALRTYPLVIIGGLLQQNPFFVPPDQLLLEIREELRRARDVLETTVAERTAELRRSEAYLSEAQRVTHTGTAALNGVTGEITHSSAEHSRLYGFDPETRGPLFQRVPAARSSGRSGEVDRGAQEGNQ
jgi:hypothetical protein